MSQQELDLLQFAACHVDRTFSDSLDAAQA
jgi:hypothetical protein